MFCKNCGVELHDGKFCPECGAPIQLEEKTDTEPKEDYSALPHLGEEKYYKKDEKVIQSALSHHVFTEPNKVIIYVGNYFPLLESYFMFVNTDEIVFCKINEKNPEMDIITRIKYSDPGLDGFYDAQWSSLKLKEDTVGFKPRKINAYPQNWNVIYNEVQRIRGREYKSLTEKPAHTSFKPVVTSAISQPKQLSKKERIKENKANAVACCPKCGSTSLSANKKGFGIGKAVVGAALTGGIGLVAGNIGAKKVVVTCLNCGHQWKA